MPSLKNLKKILLTTLLVSTTLSAQNFSNNDDTYSLVALETSYSNFDIKNGDTLKTDTYNFTSAGIKIGAQTKEYRIFLSSRYHTLSDFDYAYTLGGEFQYLFNFSKYANFYLGVNAGIAEMSFDDSKNQTRTISDPYYGGDAGFNIHIQDSLDIELGARVMSLNAQNIQNDVAYSFDNIVSGYMSLIFKYQMD